MSEPVSRRKMVEMILNNPHGFDNALLSAQIILALDKFDADTSKERQASRG